MSASLIWCVVGVLLGWLGGRLGGDGSKSTRIEAVLVGVFGAFVGGEFLPSMFMKLDKGFNMTAFSMAVATAIVGLVLLRMMRRAAGPLRPHKRRQKG